MTTPALHLDLTSDPAHIARTRKRVEAFAVAAGFDERAVADVGLCVNEAIANVIRHAYHGATDRPIELNADVGVGDVMTITLRDWGDGRVPDLASVGCPDAPLRPGGLGLPCLKALMDELAYEKQPDGVLLRMSKRKR